MLIAHLTLNIFHSRTLYLYHIFILLRYFYILNVFNFRSKMQRAVLVIRWARTTVQTCPVLPVLPIESTAALPTNLKMIFFDETEKQTEIERERRLKTCDDKKQSKVILDHCINQQRKKSLNFLCNLLLLYLVNVSLLWPNNSFFSLSSEPK